jgi:beta-phosphoglucomutase-like phosphatase (HAD superfamily)
MKSIGFTPLAAIFDVDDTLLDNHPHTQRLGLHEQARLLALREVGQKHDIDELINTTEEQNKSVINRALEHTVEGGIWQLFYELSLVKTRKIDHANSLLREVAARKHELYEPVLREFGAPIPLAAEFVKAVSFVTNGKIAIASGAQRRSVTTFFEVTGLTDYFSEDHIFCSGDFPASKPDPSSFNMAFLSLSLEEKVRPYVLAFEDDPKGVESAKRAGLFVCAITSRFTAAELADATFKPDMIRSSYIEFAEALGITL